MAIDPKPTTPPDPAKPIPVRQINFHPGTNLDIPGKKITTNGVTGESSPSKGSYWTIGYMPRLRSFLVSHFEPGDDLARPPSRTAMVMESVICTWVPMGAV